MIGKDDGSGGKVGVGMLGMVGKDGIVATGICNNAGATTQALSDVRKR